MTPLSKFLEPMKERDRLLPSNYVALNIHESECAVKDRRTLIAKCEELGKRISFMESEVRVADFAFRKIQGQAGHPVAAEGCREIIKTAEEARVHTRAALGEE